MKTLITSVSRGIGREMAIQLAATGEQVIGLGRAPAPDLEARGIEVHHGLDLTDLAGVSRFAATLAPASLNRVIASAGVRVVDDFADFTIETVRHQIEVNAVAPLHLVRALAPALKDGAKIGLVSTRAASLGDNGRGGEFGYRMSKAALNMAGVNLAIALRPRGVAVFLLHPGFVRTDLTRGEGLIDADQSAAALLAAIDRLGLADSGSFVHALEGQQLPW